LGGNLFLRLKSNIEVFAGSNSKKTINIIKGIQMKNKLTGLCLFLVVIFSFLANAQEQFPSNSNIKKQEESDIWDVFKTRRSVRAFTKDSVPEADIIKIIDAARTAPTSGNQQPWKFLVIRDKNKINQMKEKCVKKYMSSYDPANSPKTTKQDYEKKVRARLDNYFSAPVYIVVLTDNKSTYPDYNHWDGPLAAGYLMLAARALGYGTVFITDAISESITKDVLQIPDRYTRVCITPLGVPVEWPVTPPKKNLEDFIVFEKF
jgi:nitroreductase